MPLIHGKPPCSSRGVGRDSWPNISADSVHRQTSDTHAGHPGRNQQRAGATCKSIHS